MIDALSASSRRFLTDLNGVMRRLDQAQRQLSSGKRMNVVSDDPDQVGLLLQYRADVDMNARIKTNLGRVKTEVDSAENVMQTAVKLMQDARVLGTQGVTGTATPESRQALATQLGTILQQMVSLSNTTVEGRYVFSGDSDQVSPYSLDLTQAVPYSAYQGTTATRQVLHPSGTTIPVSKTAQDIFDSPVAGQSVFASINALRLALESDNQAGIEAAVTDIDTASVYLNVQHSFYGSAQLQINNAIDSAEKASVRLKSQVSQLEDADMTSAILQLSDALTQQRAALESRAQLPKNSLFDYLG